MSKTSEKRARRMEARRKQDPQPTFLENRTLWVAAGLVLLVIIGVALAIFLQNQPLQASATTPAPAGTPGPVGTVGASPAEVAVPNLGGNHVKPGEPHIAYNSNPPTSGPHYDTPAAWSAEGAMPEETWLHNLEHGGIAGLYNCPQGCPDIVKKLEDWRKLGPQSKYGYMKMVIVPYAKLPTKLAFAAWNYYLLLDDWDEPAIRAFFKAHQDHGPEDVP